MIPATIPHAARCTRPAPLLRLSWAGAPEAWCPSCGRATPAPDTRERAQPSRHPWPAGTAEGAAPLGEET